MSADAMLETVSPRRLRSRALTVVGLLGVIVLIYLLAPGLSGARRYLSDAAPGWLIAAAVFELASCISYVLMFRPVFCRRMPWGESFQIGLSELAVGSIVPASGAGGLAVGAWILRRRGMSGERIARRTVAFFLIKSSVNFVAVAIIGSLMAFGVIGPSQPLGFTLVPAILAILTIALVLLVPRFGEGSGAGPDASRTRRASAAVRRWLVGGTSEAWEILKTGNLLVFIGSIGYWAFDNAALWAAFHAVGDVPPMSVILMGYLIGQLGGLLPLPGGVGGIDGGLIGTFVVYGASASATAAAVLAYRLILFWLPLILGGPAFIALWRRIKQREPAFS
jgi:uncharacterized protein (TIRG00374 family)